MISAPKAILGIAGDEYMTYSEITDSLPEYKPLTLRSALSRLLRADLLETEFEHYSKDQGYRLNQSKRRQAILNNWMRKTAAVRSAYDY